MFGILRSGFDIHNLARAGARGCLPPAFFLDYVFMSAPALAGLLAHQHPSKRSVYSALSAGVDWHQLSHRQQRRWRRDAFYLYAPCQPAQ
mmetsp:Transcript_3357/g.3930  ORF Transcript_3357/g.3930 Transcript_3357/m.3930 type:complete len:90 (-) Transcript_3357:18-287(-)